MCFPPCWLSWLPGLRSHTAHSSYQLFPEDPWAPAGASTSLEQEALFTLSWSLVLIHKREKSPLGKGQGAWKLFKSESFVTGFCCFTLLVDTAFQNIKTHALWTSLNTKSEHWHDNNKKYGESVMWTLCAHLQSADLEQLVPSLAF